MKLSDSSPGLGGGDSWPPGFRFHPTDEELVLYYLKRKICHKRLKFDIIAEIDVYKWEPEQLPGQSKVKSGDKQWFFFSPRDRKYPNGARANRGTRHGYWKATGKDRVITYQTRLVGVKKTLVFYRGRAPTGERTDWVMHEYVLDEEELNRCKTDKDCYVLYKLYKKSGPGPKNGEQYGAPFKEEDWVDDEEFLHNVKGVDLFDNSGGDNQVQQSLMNDLEEFMSRIADEPLQIQPLDVDFNYELHRAVGDEETGRIMLESSLEEQNLCERSIVIHPNSQQCAEHASFDVTGSATSQLLLHEAPEVTSAPDNNGKQSYVGVEDLLEDFLEMDDLIGPEPTVQNVENPVENLRFEQLDGFNEFDLYHDAAMFLLEMVPVDQMSVPDRCLNNIENDISDALNNLDNGMVSPVSHLYLNNLENDFVNPVSTSLSNNLNNGMENHSNDGYYTSSQLSTGDQQSRVFTTAELDWTVPQPISGMVYADDNPSNLTSGVNQNQSDQGDGGTDSWFSSALWAFVESVPTTPASASENVNRAFERMSSFGRLRGSSMTTNNSVGNSTASSRSLGKYNRGFLCFAVLGVLCAILWVLIGTSIKVLGRCISS